MKTSIILIVLISVNTSALFAELIANLVSGINIWILLVAEAMLCIGYYINNLIRSVRKVSEIDLNDLNIFSTKGKKSA